jgi:hypothetical protein
MATDIDKTGCRVPTAPSGYVLGITGWETTARLTARAALRAIALIGFLACRDYLKLTLDKF